MKAEEQLLFVVNAPGSSPYLYYDKYQNKYVGIIPDLLQGVTKLNIRFVSNSRKRSEEQIYTEKADMIMLSTAWLKHPEKVISTIPIHQHRSFLYRAKKFPVKFSLEKSNNSELVCTRKGYLYPNLMTFFGKKRLERVDASNHLSMMKMLFRHRCDYTVMNEFNAQNVMESQSFKGKRIFRSELPVSTVPLNIILRAELTSEKTILDNHIRQLQESGEFDRIMKKYVYTEPLND